MVTAILLVGVGGFAGSVLRYLLSRWVHEITKSPFFPYGTLTVNVAGCLCIGFLDGLVETRQLLSPQVRMLLLVGFMGGFTTFSSFGYETIALARDGELLAALANIALQLVLGLGAVWVGYSLAKVV